jgi:outer membrane immunogenic protein
MKKFLLVAFAGVALLPVSALAADMGAPVYKAPPPPAPPPPSFTGCYVNGGAGYGLWNIDHNFNSVVDELDSSSQTTSGGRGWLGTAGGGCDYQFGYGSGFWSNWVVGAFADYDFMDLHRNFDESGFAGDEKESSAWAVGARIGYLVTPNVFTYWNGGYTQSNFGQINASPTTPPIEQVATIGSHTYSGWFIGGGTEIALSGLFGLPLPAGLFWRSEYRYSSFDSANLAVIGVPPAIPPIQIGSENMKPFVQTITTSLVWKFNWFGH